MSVVDDENDNFLKAIKYLSIENNYIHDFQNITSKIQGQQNIDSLNIYKKKCKACLDSIFINESISKMYQAQFDSVVELLINRMDSVVDRYDREKKQILIRRVTLS
jgi:hypothetical protein